MIILVKFLSIIEEISEYNKKDIDLGNTPLDIYGLCSIIREAFCLSYSIRKSNELYIMIKKSLSLLKFQGNNLKYLGSDERSQALLLLKALDKLKMSQNNYWKISTPGISIKKIDSLLNFYSSIDKLGVKKVIISNEMESKNFTLIKDIPINEQDIIIIEPEKDQLETSLLNNFIRIELPNTTSVEDKILYINYQLDQQNG